MESLAILYDFTTYSFPYFEHHLSKLILQVKIKKKIYNLKFQEWYIKVTRVQLFFLIVKFVFSECYNPCSSDIRMIVKTWDF